MGWDTANGQFEFASNVSIFEDVVTVNDYGNVKVDTLLGNVDGVNANLSGNVQGHSVISTSGFFLGPTTISEDYTIPAGFNAFTPGPVTVPSGVVVTVPPGSNWTVP